MPTAAAAVYAYCFKLLLSSFNFLQYLHIFGFLLYKPMLYTAPWKINCHAYLLLLLSVQPEYSLFSCSRMSRYVRLWLVGDVMLARAIDMTQKHSCDPRLYEGNGLSAHDYVRLAVERYGPLPEPSQRGPGYVWGDTVEADPEPDLRIINLETSITTSMTPWPRKAVHYKMHPLNVDVIKVSNSNRQMSTFIIYF